MAIHFNSTKERLDFLKGKHEEYKPVEYIPVETEEEKPEAKAKAKAEPKKESKPKKKTESKDKKK